MSYSYDRTAAATNTLLSAKVEWAEKVAEALVKHLKSGGWGIHGIKAETRNNGAQVDLEVRSEKYEWTGYASFRMEGSSDVTAYVLVDEERAAEVEDLMDTLSQMNAKTRTIPVNDRTSADSIVKEVSLWFSRTVNQIPK